MNAKEALLAAKADLDAAGLPAELHQAAFVRVLDHYLRDVTGDGGRAQGSHTEVKSSGNDNPPVGEKLATIARRIGVKPEVIEDVYHLDGDQLGIGIAPSKLDSTASRGAQQIAILLAAGRQAAGFDDGWTALPVIREVCRDYGKFDSANFATTIGRMSSVFTFKGKGQSREVHVTRPGWDQARILVERLTDSTGT